MITRSATVAGQFYPRNKEDLEDTIKKFESEEHPDKVDITGCVVPHAGYIYSGEVLASVYKNIGNKNPIFVILGPNHSGSGPMASLMSSGKWKTPFGESSVHNEFALKILGNSNIFEDDISAHSREHSIEVQLPWLQYMFDEVDFVPICLNAGMMDVNGFKNIGKSISKAIEETSRDVVFIASSDFTHFGPNYAYTPVDGTVEDKLDFIENVDKDAGEKVTNLDPEGFSEVMDEYDATICGYGPIIAMLYAVKNRSNEGSIVDYTTSYEVSGNPNSIVGYCGIVLPRK